MWNRVLGKAPATGKESSTTGSRQKSDNSSSTSRRAESIKSNSSSRKKQNTEESDRGFTPTSTSYSSTTQNKYPGTASASIASSYATASNDPTTDSYLPPGLVRNASLANQIPRSFAGDDKRAAAEIGSAGDLEEQEKEYANMDRKKDRRERRDTGDRDDDRRENKDSRSKKSRRDSKGGSKRSMSIDDQAETRESKGGGTSRAADGITGTSVSGSFSAQYDTSGPGSSSAQAQSQSSHIHHQFPGQFPAQAAAPYRPPLAASEGGPGLAAEYYGDAGQSVADQPGFRTHSPSLIIGAEPHLQAASAMAAPPAEPSASGGVGAAASFFDGTFSAGSDAEGRHHQKPPSTTGSSMAPFSSAAPPTSTYAPSTSAPSYHTSSSAPIVPTLGAAAAGAAAGHYMSSHSSRPDRPNYHSASVSGHGQISSSSDHHHHQNTSTHGSYTTLPSSSRPPTRPGKHSSQSSNVPLYAAGAAGVAAAAYHHNHHNHSNSQHSPPTQNYNGGPMAQKHRHRSRGPLSTFVDFFKDPDGVAQFEEYTEYIGVCSHCFAPGSSPRDAPRRHRYHKRRSNERLGSSVRVDKDNRYWSSENEKRRRKNKSWLGAGLAGYGLAKVGEGLFGQDSSSEDSHNVKSTKARRSHRRSSSSSSDQKSKASYSVKIRSSDSLSRRDPSHGRVETGITGDGKFYRKDSHGHLETTTVKPHKGRRRSRSSSRDGHERLQNLAIGAAVGSTVAVSSSRRRSRSPKKAFVRSKHGNRDGSELSSVLKLHDSESHGSLHQSHQSPSRRHRKDRKKEKKNKGFFNFSNGSSSSSSSSSDQATRRHGERRKTKDSNLKKRDKEAEAALLGLGAAALAINQTQRSKRKGEVVAIRESKGRHKPSRHDRKHVEPEFDSQEDLWESASEGEWSSADSELAYGASLRRQSQESLSSDSSGLDKWSWRWGSKKQSKKNADDRRRPSNAGFGGSVAAMNDAVTSRPQAPSDHPWQDSRMTSTSSIPMQHVYPMPTTDPTQFDVAGLGDPGTTSYHAFVNSRPDPVPIQHPQPVAPVSSSVYSTQAPYVHSYSAPTAPSSLPRHSVQRVAAAGGQDVVSSQAPNAVPGAFPSGSEYFEPFMRDPVKESKPRRRDTSPVTRTSELTSSSSTGPRRRKSLKDDSSVRFDLTKEQEEKDRRDERRRRKDDEKRRRSSERQDSDDQKQLERSSRSSKDQAAIDSSVPSSNVKESWSGPAAAGAVAAIVGASIAAEKSKKQRFEQSSSEDEATRMKNRNVAKEATDEVDGRGRPAKKESVWQTAVKNSRSSSHTDYAAYFSPAELLSKAAGAKETAGANADADVAVQKSPRVITVEPSASRGHSPSRAYSFPVSPEDGVLNKKPLPWAVPMLNLVEPTPPTSRAPSVAGSRSPQARSPLSNEVPIDIPLEPLESITDANDTYAEPEHVEYTVIEPKGRSTDPIDTAHSEVEPMNAVPGISSLKNRKAREVSPPKADFGDDLDFAATVAAGLQDTGFNPSIVIDDPSFRRRDSPPGSEDDDVPKRSTGYVTEATEGIPPAKSRPLGFVEELPEHHMPGSFEDEGGVVEATGPADNNGIKAHVFSVEPDAFETADVKNATIDPESSRNGWNVGNEKRDEDSTGPADNAGAQPHVYSAEPESFESEDTRSVTVDPTAYESDGAPSTAASAPLPSSTRQSSKSSKKSKRRSVGFDDTTSAMSSPATYSASPEPSSQSKKGRKGGVFGLFSKSTDNLAESQGIQETPVEASLEDFEEPKKRGKSKSKSRKGTIDENDVPAATTESMPSIHAEDEDELTSSKKSKRSKEKRRSSEGTLARDPGRMTQDLPAQVIPPASYGYESPSPPNKMLTNSKDQEPGGSSKNEGATVKPDERGSEYDGHDNGQPSFLGDRPEKPRSPELPDSSEDPGGQLQGQDNEPSGDRVDSPATKADKLKWRLSDVQSDGRSVSYPSSSPTAIPLRPLRFGRRPSSPGLAKSLPSTPQPSDATDPPVTPRRRERPHSTEFKSNEFRPMWLLEKHGSRQGPAPQETYPSLPSSHSTSRASSVHEADDLEQTHRFNRALDELSYPETMPGFKGLSIDTSRHELDSELLDSQQATPTAASFHSVLKEGNPASSKALEESGIASSHEPEEQVTDTTPRPGAYVDPAPRANDDHRLLHGVEDIFPQPRSRSQSPARYVTSKDVGASEAIEPRPSSPPVESEQSKGGFTSMLKDAALGAFLGGSAATLLDPGDQHMQQDDQTPSTSDVREAPQKNTEPAPSLVKETSGRPSAEELQKRQEQDAQDAVDSWFTPELPKKAKSDKKGKKRNKSYDKSE
ncbi:MAG: hypothetical protein Q9174_002382, partial [Haloplaca sp. 1 TL-2023]